MNKKIVSAIALGVLFSSIFPIIANAQPISIQKEVISNSLLRNDFIKNSISEKYPKLKTINSDALVNQKFSKDIYDSLDSIISKLNKAINSNDIEQLNIVLDDFLKLHTTVEYEDIVLHSEYDQFDYIFFNSIALMFELTDNNLPLRNEMLSKLMDNMYLSSAKKFNTLGYGSFISRYGQYTYKSLSEYIKDERTVEIMLHGFCMLNSIEDYGYRPIVPEDKDTPSKSFFPEDQLPSTIKPDLVPPPPEISPEVEIPPIKPPVKRPAGNGEFTDTPKDYEEFEFE
ncbi:hypothetical protein [Clostridium algidicarnis]|uniref:hypothetical protein n=1 Tax=Clostridium algidicarnis TaxID=37659 RepID=UPI001C0E7121|nr:hypothetical protein [Clostridium algidicarnis]MBU3194936.1 hypothetical protein [Clostridium algidicarnis]